AASSFSLTRCSLCTSTSVTRSTTPLCRTSRIESMRLRSNSPAQRAASSATSRTRSRSTGVSLNAPGESALSEASRGWRRHVVRRSEHNRALVAGRLAQIARDTCLGVRERSNGHPRLVLVDHAQALEWADVYAVPAAAADLLLNHRARPLGAPHLLRGIP